jgi:glycosyltransferase involved in cell wall biosynthesis
MSVLHSGIDTSIFGTFAEIPRLHRGMMTLSTPIIFHPAARIRRSKGTHKTVEAFARIQARHPTASLVLCGTRSPYDTPPDDLAFRREIEQNAKDLGIKNMHYFRFSRAQTGDALRVVALNGVVVHPSLTEGLGLVTVEAQACGAPVVATAVGGQPEAVIDGQSGLLVPPDDSTSLANAVLDILDHPELRNSLVEGGLKHSRSFEFGTTVIPEILKVYDAVLEGGYIRRFPSTGLNVELRL